MARSAGSDWRRARRDQMMTDAPVATRDEISRWFEEYQETGDREIRNRIVESQRPVAEYYTRRYGRRGVASDDLLQVALLSVVRAVDRFDPARGVEFSTFAGRTIDGELKRYFRDRTWTVRPPR